MTVIIASAPSGATVSSIFSVTVDGTNVPVYVTPIGHFCNFQTDEAVDVVVDFNASITAHEIKPLRHGISGSVSGDDLSFTLTDNGYYSVEINGPNDIEESSSSVPLIVCSNPIEVGTPSPSDPNVTYLTPGWWYVNSSGAIVSGSSSSTPSNVYYNVAQGKTLYIADGAILRGKIRIGSDSSGGTGVTDATIMGYGIVDASAIASPENGRPLRINHSSGVVVDGPTFLGARHWGVVGRKSNSCWLDHIKVFSWRENGVGTPDGIDMVGCNNMDIQNFFSRAYDDGTTIKSDMPGGGWSAAVYNIRYENGVIYNGWAGNAMEVGYEVPQEIKDSYWKNIDVVNKMARSSPITRDAISIYNNGAGRVHHITFENITVDHCEENYVGIIANSTGEIDNILVKNAAFAGGPTALPVKVQGKSGGTVDVVTFENLSFAGVVVDESTDVDFETNAYATNVTFVDTTGGGGTPQPETHIADKVAWVKGNNTKGAGVATLEMKNSSDTNLDRKAFLQFDLNDAVLTSVSVAKLRLYLSTRDKTSGVGAVPTIVVPVFPVSDDSWTESSLAWSGPTNSGSIATTTIDTDLGVWYEWDITAHINSVLAGDKKVSLLVYDNLVTDVLFTFHGRTGANPPELLLEP